MKLKELHLHNNKLGYEGVEKLCEELAKPLSKASSRPGNKIIEALVLRSNGIGKHCEGDKVCGICRFSPEFPTALLELTSLHLIDLNHNVLTYVPLEIAKLPKLMGLDLRNNTIANIPDKVMVTARCGKLSYTFPLFVFYPPLHTYFSYFIYSLTLALSLPLEVKPIHSY
jgi:Leucine-rich repeat (LRR) protein